MIITIFTIQLVHFGYNDTPVERQYPCPEKQMEYVIYKNGTTDDGAYKTDSCKRDAHQKRSIPSFRPHDEPCLYKEQLGLCIVMSIEYNNSEDDAMDVYVEFRPRTAKQKKEDFKQLVLVEDDNPTEGYIKRMGIYLGTQTKCVRRTVRSSSKGDCYKQDWLFPDLDRERLGGSIIKNQESY